MDVTSKKQSERATHVSVGDTLKCGSVLVAVDLLPAARKPILLACEYADSVGAPVSLVHVVHEPGSAPGFHSNSRSSRNGLEPLEAGAKRMTDSLLAELRAAYPDLSRLHSADELLVTGLPSTRIVEIAKTNDSQMIVIGHRRRTRLGSFVEGSVAWHVIQNLSTPIVVVQQQSED